MPKARAFLYLAIVCVLLIAATPFWAQEEKAKAPEGNVEIVTLAKKKGLKIVKMVKPVYPPEAKAKGIEGLVRIDVVVNSEGSVTEAEATRGPEILKTAAVEAVRQWKYKPLGVEVSATVHVNYKLGPKPQPAAPKTKS
jgi:protein TonB